MTLPTDFQFSQGSLQDYVDCPRRFQLRYLLRLEWPAVEAEPPLENERHLQQGAAFHRLVHQHVLGIPLEALSRTVADPDLRRWWHNYSNTSFDLPPSRHPEMTLSAPMGSHRLVAKYDLVAVEPGRRAVILDWKTSRKRSRHKWLAERLQTRVYPYLLVQAGAHLNGDKSFEPDQVEMVYWFTDFPDDPARFPYDVAQHQADDAYLNSLIEEIAGLGEQTLPLTAEERRCKYCPYRSLCQRGAGAGALDEVEDELGPGDDPGVTLDFEQIAEIEY